MLKGKSQNEESYQPRECDVICGRGKAFASHPGNKVFLRLVRSRLNDYINATGRFDRTLIVSHIAANFRQFGVRFARVGPAQPGKGANTKRSPPDLLKSFLFYEINDERKIHEKIGHAFRDMIRAQQSGRCTSPPAESTYEEESPRSPICESDSEPSRMISDSTKKYYEQQAHSKPTPDKCVSSSKTRTDNETGVGGIKKTQMTPGKGHTSHQDNIALAFFDVESHVHKLRDDKPQEETAGLHDPFGPDVSLLFNNDSDSLAGLSFNSHQAAKDSQSGFCSNTPEDIPDRIVVHWSKEDEHHQCKIKRETSDSSRDRSQLMKNLESNYDADEAVRWSATHPAGMSIDPRRLLQEPLINDWHLDAMEYCAEFNPINFDMTMSLHSHYSHL